MSAVTTILTSVLCAEILTPGTARAVQSRPPPDTVISVHVGPILALAASANRMLLPTAPREAFKSLRDSSEWLGAKQLAEVAREFRIVVSLHDRALWVLIADDTLLTAPIAVASGLTLEYAGRRWTFRTPRGRHGVLGKTTDPKWAPPDWLYAEVALEHGLALRPLTSSIVLSDGRSLAVRNAVVGVVDPGIGLFEPLPIEEHIVFDSTLFIPPLGTLNRRLSGELGRYALDLGDGYLLHGTSQLQSIGTASTHGCIRLRDEDLAWLYAQVPVGTPVYIY